MSFPEGPVDNRTAGGKTGAVMAVLLFLAVISIAVFTYLNSQDIDIRKASIGQLAAGMGGGVKAAETLYAIPFDSREHPSFSIYKNYVVKCSKDGIRLLDKKGDEVLTETVPFNQPIARTNGRELLVADAGGRDLYVLNEGGILWKDTLDVDICNADISKEGYVTLVTSSKRYNNEIRVYDSHGIELFRTFIANDFAVSAKISPSSKQLVVDGINAGGIKAVTSLRFLDMKGSELGIRNLDTSDSLFPSVFYTDDDGLFAAGDKSVMGFDRDGNAAWEKKFSGVSGACLTGGRKLAVVADGDGGTGLAVYSADGKALASCAVDGRAGSVSAGAGLIAVSTKREVSFYNEKCRLVGKYTAGSDIADVYFFSRQQAVAVTRNQVSVIGLG